MNLEGKNRKTSLNAVDKSRDLSGSLSTEARQKSAGVYSGKPSQRVGVKHTRVQTNVEEW